MALPRSNPSSLVTLATAVIVIAALVFAKEILLPIAVAILLSFVLTPVAEWIERWGLGRVPSVALVVVLAFTILGGIGWIVTTQVIDLSQKMTNYESNVVAKIRAIAPSSATFNRMTTVLEDVGKQLTEPPSENGQTSPPGPAPRQTGKSAPATSPATSSKTLPEHSDDAVEVKVVEMPPSPLAQVQTWLGPLVAPLTTAGIVVVLVLFMLIHREDQRNRLIRLFGAANLHTTTEALNDAATRISRYLRMQFLINAGYGILVGLGLSIIGVPNAIMWGVVGFALRFLPYIGPWMAAVTPIAVSLAVSPGWTQPLLVIGWYVILEVIAANVVEPWL
ncbi:MAG TPA: AI-2E family transporter, partial [Lacipirellulaceae bacterium]